MPQELVNLLRANLGLVEETKNRLQAIENSSYQRYNLLQENVKSGQSERQKKEDRNKIELVALVKKDFGQNNRWNIIASLANAGITDTQSLRLAVEIDDAAQLLVQVIGWKALTYILLNNYTQLLNRLDFEE